MAGSGAFVLLEDMLAGGEARSRLYRRPAGSTLCRKPQDLAGFFGTIESWRRRSLPVLLLLDYEFGNLLDAAAVTPALGARACVAAALAVESVLAGTTRDGRRSDDQDL